MLGAGSFSYAAQIISGQFNVKTQKVELNVSYSGGGSQHSFKLELADYGCRESTPVQCDLNLVHFTSQDRPDTDLGFITQDLELDLPDEVLEGYFRAFLTILGDDDTSVSFQLP